eukprot:Skav222007  [mRNA]  locus=scaffold2020:251262:253549:- [translate_table: standard]
MESTDPHISVCIQLSGKCPRYPQIAPGALSSGKTYTLELPRGAVLDLAGNLCNPLAPERFNFRAAMSPVGSTLSPVSNNSSAAKPHLSSPTPVEKDVPSFAQATSAAETAYRAAAAAAERLRGEDGAKPQPSGPSGTSGTSSWAQRPEGRPKASPKVHPEGPSSGREGFNAGRARRSNPNAEGWDVFEALF